MPPRRQSILLIAVAAAAIAAGCDKISELAGEAKQQAQQVTQQAQQQVKQVVSNTVEDVKQSTGAAGTVELQLAGPVTANGCYASLLQVSGRPAILQVASYNDSTNESFPSFFLRAQTDQTEPGGLIGAPMIAAEVYVQAAAGGPIWHVTAGQPAQIVVRSAGPGGFTADLQGEFINSDTGVTQQVTGTMNGIWK